MFDAGIREPPPIAALIKDGGEGGRAGGREGSLEVKVLFRKVKTPRGRTGPGLAGRAAQHTRSAMRCTGKSSTSTPRCIVSGVPANERPCTIMCGIGARL